MGMVKVNKVLVCSCVKRGIRQGLVWVCELKNDVVKLKFPRGKLCMVVVYGSCNDRNVNEKR